MRSLSFAAVTFCILTRTRRPTKYYQTWEMRSLTRTRFRTPRQSSIFQLFFASLGLIYIDKLLVSTFHKQFLLTDINVITCQSFIKNFCKKIWFLILRNIFNPISKKWFVQTNFLFRTTECRRCIFNFFALMEANFVFRSGMTIDDFVF